MIETAVSTAIVEAEADDTVAELKAALFAQWNEIARVLGVHGRAKLWTLQEVAINFKWFDVYDAMSNELQARGW